MGVVSQDRTRTTFQHDGVAARFGVAEVEITPPVGIYARNWGAARHDVAESVHRPLMATVMTIRTAADRRPLVLVCADLGWWRSGRLFNEVHDAIAGKLGLEADQLWLALSHTHSGPALLHPGEPLPGTELIAPWLSDLKERLVAAVGQALKRPFAGVLEWHSGHCRLATPRDLPEPGGRRILCGFSPGEPAGQPVTVGRLTDSAGRPRAMVVHYACHPTTLAWQNRAISPDYVGALREMVRDQLGCPLLFLQGASGDLAPRHQYVGDPEVADRNGRQLGLATLSVVHDMLPPSTQYAFSKCVESGAPLAVWRAEPRKLAVQLDWCTDAVDLPLKDWPTADELDRQRMACDDRAVAERLRRQRDIRRTVGDGTALPVPFYAARLGDAVLAGCCGEAYSALQQFLQREMPERTVLWINVLNGSIGYLPPAGCYERNIYQVWQTPFARGALERLQERVVERVGRLLHPAG